MNANEKADYIRNRRIDMGLSQEDVAALIPIDFRFYRQIEQGVRHFDNITFKDAIRICRFLKIDPLDLAD